MPQFSNNRGSSETIGLGQAPTRGSKGTICLDFE